MPLDIHRSGSPATGSGTDAAPAGLRSRRDFLGGVAVTFAAIATAPRRVAAHTPSLPDQPVFFRNVRLFDGRNPLRGGVGVLVRGTQIEAVDGRGEAPPGDARIIDGGGRVLMPGLIDAHFHALFAALPPSLVKTADTAYINLLATQDAERTLLRGFTAVRDVGGPSFALKRAIDEGLVAGPRIYPSGLPISQTSGHGDLREIYEVPSVTGAPPTRSEQLLALIADSPDEVRRCTREQLMLGASQIKLMAGGGIVSHRDPIDATQYSEAELRAAVEAAADWNTYVTTHVYTPTGIRRSIAAGVRCIEHGHLADEDCARMMADRGVWWSLQPFVAVPGQREFPDDERQSKLDAVLEGTDRAYKLARKFNVRTAFGTDQFFNPAGAARQTDKLVALKRWYSGTEIIRMATHDNAALLALSGPRNPYPHPLGVIEAGAYADMLLVDGDPIDNPELLVDADRNIRLIMKDGRIFKDSLS